MPKSLSNSSSEATEETNTTGVMTPILEFTPDDGLMWRILEQAVRTGNQVGIPVYWDPKQGASTDLPLDTKLSLQYKAPSMDDRQTVSEVRDNIQPWRARDLSKQQNEEYIDSVKLTLKGGADELRVRDIDTFYVSVDASAQIDWTNASLFFDPAAVEEGSL